MRHECYEPVIIPKQFLVDKNYYAGKCRNAVIARWDAATNQFYHWRTKFGKTFIETIEYWDPEGRFDQFIPVFDVGPDFPEAIPIPEGDQC
jgi:hypothetical protein